MNVYTNTEDGNWKRGSLGPTVVSVANGWFLAGGTFQTSKCITGLEYTGKRIVTNL